MLDNCSAVIGQNVQFSRSEVRFILLVVMCIIFVTFSCHCHLKDCLNILVVNFAIEFILLSSIHKYKMTALAVTFLSHWLSVCCKQMKKY